MIRRKKYHDKIDNAFKSVPIVTLIGSRQVGKTSIMGMYKFKGDVLLLNGQDPDIASLFQHFSDIETYLKVKLNREMKGLIIV